MPNPADNAKELAAAVQAAASSGEPISIRGAGTKRFCTGDIPGTPLDVTHHRGIVSYEPTELVITARAGTPLGEIEAVLAERNQMLGLSRRISGRARPWAAPCPAAFPVRAAPMPAAPATSCWAQPSSTAAVRSLNSADKS